jgi:hypothetical protein
MNKHLKAFLVFIFLIGFIIFIGWVISYHTEYFVGFLAVLAIVTLYSAAYQLIKK